MPIAMQGRDLVRKFFRRQPIERAPFLPTAFYQAARIDGAPANELIGQPPRLSRAIIELSRLLQSDAVAVRLESAVHTACGIEPAWPTPDGAPVVDAGQAQNHPDVSTLLALAEPLLITIGSVKAELRGEKPVIAVVPGPIALAERLGGALGEAAAVAALRSLADAACKAGAELLVVEEADADDGQRLKRLAGPIVNTARYYSASVVLTRPSVFNDRLADAQLLPGHAFDGAPAGMLLGLAPTGREFTDESRRSDLIDLFGTRAGSAYLSLDDEAMAGREIPDVLSVLAEFLHR